MSKRVNAQYGATVKRITVSLTVSHSDMLDRISAATGVSASWVVRKALEDFERTELARQLLEMSKGERLQAAVPQEG